MPQYGAGEAALADSVVVRVATYNIEDVRTEGLTDPANPRLRELAAVVQRLRPDVLLLNEIAYDQPGAPGYVPAEGPGQNPRRFVENFLAVSQGEGLAPIGYEAFTAPTNTGLASGFDLDESGVAVTDVPPVPPSGPAGEPGEQTPEGRAYGNDAWGFGTFPGQYGMALLVREDLEILRERVRTFRLLPWTRMPGARLPVDPETGEPWYDAEERAAFRLSSKSHWDIPVRMPNGTIVHLLISHPTPPAFEGPERKNTLRNMAEIRFWADYLSGADYIVSDSGVVGGLDEEAPFLIMGDLNADPDEGSALDDPVGTFLLSHPRVQGGFVPRAAPAMIAAYPDLDPDDTAAWGLRVDYVLPSEGLRILEGGVWRPVDPALRRLLSDHFPVWLDLAVPPSEAFKVP